MGLNLGDPLLLAIIIIVILIAVLSIALARSSNNSEELKQKSGSGGRNTAMPLIVVIIVFFVLLIIVLFRERQNDLAQMKKVQDTLTSEMQTIVKGIVERVSAEMKDQIPDYPGDPETVVLSADVPRQPKDLEAIRVRPPGRRSRTEQYVEQYMAALRQETNQQIDELEKRLEKKIKEQSGSSGQVASLRRQISGMEKTLERATERLQMQITVLEKKIERSDGSENSENPGGSSSGPASRPPRYPSMWEGGSDGPATGPMPICSGAGAVAKIQTPQMLIRLMRIGQYPTSVDFLLTFPNGRTLNLEKMTPGTGKAFESDRQKPYFFQVFSIDNRCAMVSITSRNVE